MAQEILLQIARGKPVTHKMKHDVESFIWVFCYCVMRKLYVQCQRKDPAVQAAAAERKEFRKLFSEAFSQTNLRQIALQRVWASPALDFVQFGTVGSIIEQFMSQTLVNFFKALQVLVERTQGSSTVDLTHELLLEEINKAIASLA
jgi:hypothetical protein